MFVAEHDGKLHILGVVESKSPSNLRELAAKNVDGKAEFLGQPEWDFERMRQVPTKIEGRWYNPNEIVVSRNSTLWFGVTPAGKSLSTSSTQRIQGGLPNFTANRNVVSDAVMNELATRVVNGGNTVR
jgi:hypothetical protein